MDLTHRSASGVRCVRERELRACKTVCMTTTTTRRLCDFRRRQTHARRMYTANWSSTRNISSDNFPFPILIAGPTVRKPSLNRCDLATPDQLYRFLKIKICFFDTSEAFWNYYTCVVCSQYRVSCLIIVLPYTCSRPSWASPNVCVKSNCT